MTTHANQRVPESFRDSEIEGFVQTEHEKHLASAILEAKLLANQLLPPAVGQSLKAYIGKILAQYRLLHDEVLMRVNAALELTMGTAFKVKIETELSNLRNAIKDLECKPEIDRQPDKLLDKKLNFSRVNLITAWSAVAFLIIGDITYLTNAFQVVYSSLLTSFFAAIGVSIATLAIGFFSEIKIQKIKNRLLRWIARILIGMLIGSIFFMLGLYRTEYVNATNSQISSSPYVVMAINLLFFIAIALIYEFWIMPSKSAYFEILSKKAEEDKFIEPQNQLNALRMEAKRLEEQLHNYLRLKVKIMDFQQRMVNKVGKLYQLAVETFKKENIMRRTDGVIPECFNEPTPPLFESHTEESSTKKNVLL